ncbi:hypothetical protein OV090_33835 [Nannocystis sp. RBIL2]|uniref:hypothetical protein n=1 Tax=Nannocystis sp. RBIL2 TaxID=2996788 RepID=UPI00226E4D9E|nr:hypothetical protein [Nannocystis sp. RBIL2]MCY1069771.1 hypothetical protein [Nannocystis sp. RBIL2]
MVFALLACGPDKHSSTDASTGGSSTSGTSQPVTSGSTTTSDAPTTSSSTSSDATTDTEATSTTGTTGTTTTDDTTSTNTSGALPVEDCEEQLDQVDCEAILSRGGHSDCVWLETVAQWTRDGGCAVFAGPSRCVQGRYVGDGCFGSDCPDLERVYIRDLGDGTFDIVNNPGGTCGVEPDGWKQCSTEFPEPLSPCSCVC